MVAVDEKSFRIDLKTPFPVLEALATLTTPTPFILPERLAQTDAFTQIKEAIGSGPFMFASEEWQPGHKVVYVKNPDYVPRSEPPDWAAGGKVVKVDRVEFPRRRPRLRRSATARSIIGRTCRTTTHRRWSMTPMS